MVNLTYRHRLLFGSLVAPLFRARDGVMVLQTARYAGRE